MKKKKKQDNNLMIKIIIGIVVIIILIPIVTYISLKGSNRELDEEFNKEGYTTTNEDAFYRKITTNNTLDDFYNAMASNYDAEYQEFYYAKQSNDFIELKMIYKNSVSTSLNIITNLETNEVTYSYELAYKTAHLLLEGTSKEDYSCKVIDNNRVQEDVVKKYCDLMIDEINEYNEVKDDLLKNNKIGDLSKKNN